MMFNYPQYFNKWDVPQAGIGLISIFIHPNLINKFSLFHETGNVNEAIDLRKLKTKNRLSGDTIWTSYVIDIKTEAINPNVNILNQIKEYLILLFQSKILNFRNYPDESLIMGFLSKNIYPLFVIDFINLYFDIKEEDAILPGKKSQSYPDVQYSNGSHIRTYNRINLFKNDHNIDSQSIDQIQFPRRIEFHLTRRNCEYMHYANLDGDFNTVFYSYMKLLSQKWYECKSTLIDIPGLKESNYHYLKQIDSVAFSSAIPNAMTLEKTPRELMPNNKAGE